MSEPTSPETQIKIDKINDVLNRMQAVWDNSHWWVTQDDFGKFLKLYKEYPNKNIADKLWRYAGLPDDFVFQPHKFPVEKRLCALLHSDYCQKHNIDTLNDFEAFHFHLTADEIIQMRIPPQVATCSGHAKLFCHFAKQIGLDCRVVCTADLPKHKKMIDGHQIIAVELDGKLVAFDPARKSYEALADKTPIEKGNNLQSIEGTDKNGNKFPKYKITGILTPEEFDNVRSYQDLENIYLGKKSDRFKSGKSNIIARNMQNISKMASRQND